MIHVAASTQREASQLDLTIPVVNINSKEKKISPEKRGDCVWTNLGRQRRQRGQGFPRLVPVNDLDLRVEGEREGGRTVRRKGERNGGRRPYTFFFFSSSSSSSPSQGVRYEA